MKERYFNLFHLNPPTWSLFWEYVANIFYAVVLVRLKIKMLWLLTIIAAVVLCYEAKVTGHLSVGWGGDNISGGGIRVAYSFLAGVLAYRSSWIIRSGIGFITLSLMLLFAFLIPFNQNINWIADPLVVLFYFPLLMALRAGAHVGDAMHKVCKLFGELSYPLYMVHYPFIWLFMSYVEKYKPSLGEMAWITILGTIVMILLAYIVMKYLDAPIRKFLKNKVTSPSA